MSEKNKDVEKMIAKVMKRKDVTRAAAIDYMLVVATGRLAALWRYDESVPEGKQNKGVLALVGRKKRAPKTPKIAPTQESLEKKLAREVRKSNAAAAKKYPRVAKAAKAAKAAKSEKDPRQTEIADAAQ